MESLVNFLKEENISYKENESLHKYTTLRIGGPADVFISVSNLSELQRIYPFLHNNQIPYLIIGKGSNVLIPDEGLRGAVLKLSGQFEEMHFSPTGVVAGGGTSFVRLCLLSAKEGFGGMEFGAGIPGTVGGAVRMNAGAHGSDVSRVLKTAKVITDKGELLELGNEDLAFAYRTSILNEKPWLVYEATFSLSIGDASTIAERTSSFKEKRMTTQPLKMRSCGSVFKNPLPNYAGDLIERVGLKGYQVGGAQISELHGNFIVNLGGAKASDVIALIEKAQTTVKEQFGIDLVPEVKLINNYQEVSECTKIGSR